MQDHARGWAAAGGSLLLAAASHGWVLLLGVAVILGVTYLTAYLLIHKLDSRKIGWATIITPFLTIRVGLERDRPTADADADDKGTIAEPVEPAMDDKGAKSMGSLGVGWLGVLTGAEDLLRAP